MLDWIRSWLARAAAAGDAGRGSRQDRHAGWMREAAELNRSGDSGAAQALCQRILEEDPDHAAALFLLGEIAEGRGDHGAAAGLIGRAVSISGDNAHYHYALGCVLGAAGDWHAAAASYRDALAREPGHAAAHLNLGCLLQARGELEAAAGGGRGEGEARLQEALAHLQAVAEIAPDHPDAWLNLGYAMARHGRLAEARAHYDRALALDPGSAQARFNRSMVLLALGDYAQGWRDYESRWEAGAHARPRFDKPEWDGSAPAGRTLLLYTEQGYGDAIQFVRYAALLAAQQARVIVRCPPELARLFGGVPGVDGVVTTQQALPDFDAHCALLSLPRLLGTTVESIPSDIPYVRAHHALAGEWLARLQRAGGRINVGLAWASQSAMPNVELKSMALEALAPLRRVARVEFYSLQMGEAGARARDPGAPLEMRDLTGHIGDFADTAALLANLDLIISVDTAVAHLAGAMGRPVWTLLPYVADWRWEPAAGPGKWYPTMRLYRQARRGDWADVLDRVAADLQQAHEWTLSTPA